MGAREDSIVAATSPMVLNELMAATIISGGSRDALNEICCGAKRESKNRKSPLCVRVYVGMYVYMNTYSRVFACVDGIRFAAALSASPEQGSRPSAYVYM